MHESCELHMITSTNTVFHPHMVPVPEMRNQFPNMQAAKKLAAAAGNFFPPPPPPPPPPPSSPSVNFFDFCIYR